MALGLREVPRAMATARHTCHTQPRGATHPGVPVLYCRLAASSTDGPAAFIKGEAPLKRQGRTCLPRALNNRKWDTAQKEERGSTKTNL